MTTQTSTALLKLRTGRGVWHAEGIGADELQEGKAGTQMRGLSPTAISPRRRTNNEHHPCT